MSVTSAAEQIKGVCVCVCVGEHQTRNTGKSMK